MKSEDYACRKRPRQAWLLLFSRMSVGVCEDLVLTSTEAESFLDYGLSEKC